MNDKGLRSVVEIRDKIHRLRMLRAGSIFDKHFEAGEIYMLMWVLSEEPDLKSRKDVQEFAESVPCSPKYTREYMKKEVEK
jgi:hypothetical protein